MPNTYVVRKLISICMLQMASTIEAAHARVHAQVHPKPDTGAPTAAEHRVAIIGGGIAGVATAKALRVREIECTLFERKASVGGLWLDAYPGAQVQAMKEHYELPELRMPESVPQHPSAADVVQYVEKYVDVFDLRGCLRLETEVLSVKRAKGSADSSAGTRLRSPSKVRRARWRRKRSRSW